MLNTGGVPWKVSHSCCSVKERNHPPQCKALFSWHNWAVPGLISCPGPGRSRHRGPHKSFSLQQGTRGLGMSEGLRGQQGQPAAGAGLLGALWSPGVPLGCLLPGFANLLSPLPSACNNGSGSVQVSPCGVALPIVSRIN